MKGTIRFLLCIPGVLVLLASCEKDFTVGVPLELRAMQLGYHRDNSENAARFEEGVVGKTVFVAFNDRASLEAALSQGSKEFGDVRMTESRFEFSSGPSELELRTYPDNALVRSVEVTSSDESVLRVAGIDGRKVRVECMGTGETTLTVKVKGAVNTMEAEYPLRVVSRVDLDFHITAYWLSSLVTRLRLRPSYLPMGRSSVAAHIEDSVTVVGYCEYYDFRRHGRQRLFKRDTVTFPRESREVLLRKNRLLFLRNITDAIRSIRSRTEKGSYVQVRSDGTRDTLAKDYGYVVEQVILDFNVFGADRNLEYYFTSKCERSTETYDESTGETLDNETDEDTDYRDGASLAIEKSEKNYYLIRLNDFLTDARRDSVSSSLNRRLKELGYDEDRLSDEQKQEMIDRINEHRKDNEK